MVAGESLVDLIIRPDGSIYPSPGGGPFNAARTMSRLDQPTRFLGRFSADPFGVRLADRLRQDKVKITSASPVPEPTALAIVALSGCGAPEYWFHLASTAGFQLDRPAAQQALAAGISALHIGTLGLVVEPMATEIEQLVTELPESALLLLLDPTAGPGATPDGDAYRARIKRILPRPAWPMPRAPALDTGTIAYSTYAYSPRPDGAWFVLKRFVRPTAWQPGMLGFAHTLTPMTPPRSR